MPSLSGSTSKRSSSRMISHNAIDEKINLLVADITKMQNLKTCVEAKAKLLEDLESLSMLSSDAAKQSEKEIETLKKEIETLKIMVRYLVNLSKDTALGFETWEQVKKHVEKNLKFTPNSVKISGKNTFMNAPNTMTRRGSNTEVQGRKGSKSKKKSV